MTCYCNDLSSILFNVVRAGIIIVDVVTKTIVDINPAACIMVGRDREFLVGKKCYEYLCAGSCEGCPAFISDVEEFKDIIEKKEIKLIRGDGSVMYAWLSVNVVVYNGRRLLVNTLIDISRQKEAELELARHWASAEKMLSENILQIKNNGV